MAENYGSLHIYAQPCEHFPARIVGDRIGLEALANALKYALKDGEAESSSVFAGDGEGYEVNVQCVPTLSGEPLPYYSYHESHEVHQWRERAFKAEAELRRLKHTPGAGEVPHG